MEAVAAADFRALVAHAFRATNNKGAFAATALNVRDAEALLDIIASSETFLRTFRREQGSRGASALPKEHAGDEGSPSEARPAIIRSSAPHGAVALAAPWGLLSALVEAYNYHHELVLRPDDVWQAILTQFSFYVGRHAEELRDRFVDFQGKKTLVVMMDGTLFTADYASFATQMVHENIVKNLKDASVVEWLLPGFSTTTPADEVAAAVSIMSTFQAYFMAVCCLRCGIPKVTLMGTQADWQRLRDKVDRLTEYDLDSRLMSQWVKMLAPVLDEFVRSAAGAPSVDFWDRVCSCRGGGSGPTYLTGWATVFAVFTHEGEWQGRPQVWHGETGPAEWPLIDFDRLPAAALSVPVLVDDGGTQYDTHMLAGQFAFEGCGDKGVALRPRTDWCMAYTGRPRESPLGYKHGEVAAPESEVESAPEREP